MTTTLTLSNAELAVLRVLVADAIERAPEDVAAMLDEALPNEPLRVKHSVWTDFVALTMGD